RRHQGFGRPRVAPSFGDELPRGGRRHSRCRRSHAGDASCRVVAERRPKEREGVTPVAARRHPWRSYKEAVARLADRIVEGQKPIRVLQALRWDDAVQAQFLKSKPRELPKVEISDY